MSDVTDASEVLLTAQAVSDWLGVTPKCVRKWARDGVIPAIRLNDHTVRFDRSAIRRWFAANSNDPTR